MPNGTPFCLRKCHFYQYQIPNGISSEHDWAMPDAIDYKELSALMRSCATGTCNQRS
ncbi:MAG: hypothetical protein FWF09_08280 [Bacteroidales bacterium]|nr:hypothetical protein [Bacteroidales bacterium]